MRLTFLGTRAYTERRTRRHRMHSALLVAEGGIRVMIDCGRDWRSKLEGLGLDAILVTHAHPDHAHGLTEGAPCPVYAAPDCLRTLENYPIADLRPVEPSTPLSLGPLTVEAFPVEHSTRRPAVGYRVTGGGAVFFYVSDVIEIGERARALAGVQLYIGDGATLTRPIINWTKGSRYGHSSMKTQLDWCREAGIGRAVFTHCGNMILDGDERRLGPRLRAMGRERQVDARIAHDGLEIDLPAGSPPSSPAAGT